jgi:hypothetical protein
MNDIIPTTNDVALGSGWGRLEIYRGESFRWVSNDAVVYVATLRRIDHQVQIHVEPGPGVGLKPFKLQIIQGGGVHATLDVKGRQPMSFVLPAGEPAVHALTLHTEDGGKTSPNDPRVLNFRLFKIAVSRMSADVLPAGAGYKLGTGWYPLETFNGESFRWVNNDAAVEAGASAKRALRLEIEPGPGFDMQPFKLHVLDQMGAPLAAFDVRARQFIELNVPDDVVLPTTLRLHVEGGGKTSPGDSRIMNFRVHEYDPNRVPVSAG